MPRHSVLPVLLLRFLLCLHPLQIEWKLCECVFVDELPFVELRPCQRPHHCLYDTVVSESPVVSKLRTAGLEMTDGLSLVLTPVAHAVRVLVNPT